MDQTFGMPRNWPAYLSILIQACTLLFSVQAVCANEAPIAEADHYEVLQGQLYQANVLQNDTDADGDSLTSILHSSPLNGSLTFNPIGFFTYTPREGFLGIDTFEYILSDGTVSTGPITVTLTVALPKARVVINEIMYHPASNNPPYSNPAHEFIELYNAGTLAADLSGWYFDKGISYTFPKNTTLDVDEYILVVPDGVSFISAYPGTEARTYKSWIGKLSNSGENLRLKDASGKTKDEVSYSDEGDWAARITGPVHYHMSGWIWDNQHDGGGHSLELQNPHTSNKNGQNWAPSQSPKGTPGLQNSVYTTDIAPIIKDVSHEPAIPKSTESVKVLATIEDEDDLPPQNAFLRWRTDGSSTFHKIPMTDDGEGDDGKANNLTYGATIPAQSDGTIIEFYVEADDGTNTRTWPSHTNHTPSQRGANCLYMVTNTQLNTTNTPSYRLIMTQDEYYKRSRTNIPSNDSLKRYWSSFMVNATLITTFEGRSKVRYQTGVRFRGSGSRNNNPRPYRVNIPHDDPWEGSTAMNLNPVGWESQIAGTHIFNALGQPAGRGVAVQVHFNQQRLPTNTSKFYVHLQPLNSDFAQNTFPNDSDGNLYRGRRSYEEPDPPGGKGSGLGYYSDINQYVSYSKTTNESLQNWRDVQNLTYALSSSQLHSGTNFFNPDNRPELHKHVHIDKWLEHLALHAILVNTEGGLVNGDKQGDDYAMYSGKNIPGFYLVAHDLDSLWGEMFPRNRSASQSSYTRTIFPFNGVPALNRLVNHAHIKPRYLAIVQELTNTFFQTDNFEAFLYNTLSPTVPNTSIQKMVDAMAYRTNYLNNLSTWNTFEPPPLNTEIHNTPNSPTNQTSVTFHIGGKNVTHYRYKLDDGTFSSTPVEISTPIVLENLSPGTHTLQAVGINTSYSGSWQYDIHLATTTWEIDPDYAKIQINEVLTNNQSTFKLGETYPDYVELYNPSDTPYDLSHHTLTDNLNSPAKFTFPENTVIQPGNYLLLYADSETSNPGLHLGFGLDSEGDQIHLLAPTDPVTTIDSHYWGLQLPDQSIGRTADLNWTLNSPTPGAPNQTTPLLEDTTVLRINEYLADPSFNHDTDFVEIYNPGSHPADLGSHYLTDNPLGNPTNHRIHPNTFIPANGFATFRATGKDNEKDARHLGFKLTAQSEMIALLTPHQQPIDVILYGPQPKDKSKARQQDGSLNFITLTIPTPGVSNTSTNPTLESLRNHLRITELHYNPTSSALYEYIELYNTSTSALDLSGLRFSDGITYTFPEHTTLQPNTYVTLAHSTTHYQQLYGHPPQGQYTGKLSNSGEKIRLQTPNGLGVIDFNYNDFWYPYTDGSGYTLQLRDDSTTNDLLSLPQSWSTSKIPNGSPAAPEPENTPPSDIIISPATIQHDTQAGTAFATVSHTDTFPLDEVTYALLEPASGQFSITENQLILDETLGLNQIAPIPLKIRATDSYGAVFVKDITLTILLQPTDSDSDELPDQWEQYHFGDLSQPSHADADNDSVSNYIEYLTATDPTDSADKFAMLSPEVTSSNFKFTFDAKPGKTYILQSITAPGQTEWRNEATIIIQTGIHTYSIPITDNNPAKLYRILLVP